MRGISWVDERLLAPQGRLSSIKFVDYGLHLTKCNNFTLRSLVSVMWFISSNRFCICNNTSEEFKVAKTELQKNFFHSCFNTCVILMEDSINLTYDTLLCVLFARTEFNRRHDVCIHYSLHAAERMHAATVKCRSQRAREETIRCGSGLVIALIVFPIH